jgi:hypothetical protein
MATDEEDASVQLLADVRSAFGACSCISTQALLSNIRSPDEPSYRGELDSIRLSRVLRNFGARPKTIRFSREKIAKGYVRMDFEGVVSLPSGALTPSWGLPGTNQFIVPGQRLWITRPVIPNLSPRYPEVALWRPTGPKEHDVLHRCNSPGIGAGM